MVVTLPHFPSYLFSSQVGHGTKFGRAFWFWRIIASVATHVWTNEIDRRGKIFNVSQSTEKESESESEEDDEEIPSAHSHPKDELVTDSPTLFSDGNPKKGGHGREKNTTAEMSDPVSYKTTPGVETTTERNNRLQRIHRHWAKKWFNYENVLRKYQIMFAFTPPWNDCIAENYIGPTIKRSGLRCLQMLMQTPSKPSLILPRKWKQSQGQSQAWMWHPDPHGAGGLRTSAQDNTWRTTGP